MEQTDTIFTMLDHMERPAFLVRDGRICRANVAATRYLIEEGTEVEPLLSTQTFFRFLIAGMPS